MARRALQAALLCSDVSATALALSAAEVSATAATTAAITAPAPAAAATTTTAPAVSAAATTTATSATARAVFSSIDAERATRELITIELLDRLGRFFVGRVGHKGEPANSAGVAIHRQENIFDLADTREEGLDLFFRGTKIKVAYEYFGSDVRSPIWARLFGARFFFRTAHSIAKSDSHATRDPLLLPGERRRRRGGHA